MENTYYVLMHVDANETMEVKANTVKEAMDKARKAWMEEDVDVCRGKLEILGAAPVLCEDVNGNAVGA